MFNYYVCRTCERQVNGNFTFKDIERAGKLCESCASKQARESLVRKKPVKYKK